MRLKEIEPLLKNKYKTLKSRLEQYDNLLVAYSGGVDSTLLLKVAVDMLGQRALGVIGVSPSLAKGEHEEAREIARNFSLPVIELETHEFDDEDYLKNPQDRCYFCKKILFSEIYEYAAGNGYRFIADGTNADDQGDYRPGRRAAEELKVVSPLLEAGLNKNDVRELSRHLGLPTWNKPALACLSSRIPTGNRITEQALGQVEQAEAYLRSLGFRIIRVRHHDRLARIEVGADEIGRFSEPALREQVDAYFRQLGYLFVTLDISGYRQGSLNRLNETANSKTFRSARDEN